jgi:glycolate oxidase iron-sulfur subunit
VTRGVATELPVEARGALALDGNDVEGVNRCVHCGLCLSYCPTYALLGTEMDSPRGRIVLIKSLAEGRIALTDSVAAHLNLCLGCRACETVCPSGVPYGWLIEAAQVLIERRRPGGPLRRIFRRASFEWLLPRPRMLALLTGALNLYRASGLRSLVRLPRTLRELEALLPELPPRSGRAPLPELIPAAGMRRARAGLLTGCIQQAVFAPHNRATARVLSLNGFEVAVPRGQSCCGALHAHNGEHRMALALARRTIDAFDDSGVEQVVVPSAGCGAHMKGYGHVLLDDPVYRERAERFAGKVRDVSELLAEEPLRGQLGPVPMKVTYHDPCHTIHGQRIWKEPRQLLAQIPGLRIVELQEADWCCGSAGTYNLIQPEMAGRLQERKVDNIVATGADAVVTANPGCIIQIAQGLKARGHPVTVLHLVELLDRAYGGGLRW